MNSGDDVGHLSADDIEKYFAQPGLAVRRLAEQPIAYLVIDPTAELVTLRVEASSSLPDVSAFDRISFNVVQEIGTDHEWFELTIDAEENHHEAYLVIAAVVDLVIAGSPLADAVAEGLHSFEQLLRRARRLSDEQQIGLFAELLFLGHALAHAPALVVMNAWTGADLEEHDFRFNGYCVEVKCTRSERRIHQIGSASQLQPSPDHLLYLLSVQVTAAGAASQARTLGDLVGAIRERIDVDSRRVFDRKLEEIGLGDSDIERYQRRWSARSVPQAFLVDDAFPALTTKRIAEVVPQPSHVVGVQYRLDLTHMQPSTAVPDLLKDFCKEPAS